MLTNRENKRSQFVVCNVDFVYGASGDQRQSRTSCVRSNIVTVIQSIRTSQEDADLAYKNFSGQSGSYSIADVKENVIETAELIANAPKERQVVEVSTVSETLEEACS